MSEDDKKSASTWAEEVLGPCYYALFKRGFTRRLFIADIEVVFPDFPELLAFGSSWPEAVENATDRLVARLATAKPESIKPPSKKEALSELDDGVDSKLVPIYADKSRIESFYRDDEQNLAHDASVLSVDFDKKLNDYEALINNYRSKYEEVKEKILAMVSQMTEQAQQAENNRLAACRILKNMGEL
jgi:predicted RNase H-like HicB family nuclease